jgi:hypothetical protein
VREAYHVLEGYQAGHLASVEDQTYLEEAVREAYHVLEGYQAEHLASVEVQTYLVAAVNHAGMRYGNCLIQVSQRQLFETQMKCQAGGTWVKEAAHLHAPEHGNHGQHSITRPNLPHSAAEVHHQEALVGEAPAVIQPVGHPRLGAASKRAPAYHVLVQTFFQPPKNPSGLSLFLVPRSSQPTRMLETSWVTMICKPEKTLSFWAVRRNRIWNLSSIFWSCLSVCLSVCCFCTEGDAKEGSSGVCENNDMISMAA